jgi:hypothetical protein
MCPSARMQRRLKFTMVGHWAFPSFAIGPPKTIRTCPYRHNAPEEAEGQHARDAPPEHRIGSNRIDLTPQSISCVHFRDESSDQKRGRDPHPLMVSRTPTEKAPAPFTLVDGATLTPRRNMFGPIWQGYTVRKVLTGSLFFLAAIHVVNAQTPQSFVLVAEPATHTIDAVAITPVSGALTLVPGSPFAAPNESTCTAAPGCSTTPPSIATNPNATFLFSANYTSSSVSVFSIAPNGALAEIAGSPFPISDAMNPNVLTVSPDSQLL